MKWNQNDAASWKVLTLVIMALSFFAPCVDAQVQAAEQKNAPEVYQTFYLARTGQLQDAGN